MIGRPSDLKSTIHSAAFVPKNKKRSTIHLRSTSSAVHHSFCMVLILIRRLIPKGKGRRATGGFRMLWCRIPVCGTYLYLSQCTMQWCRKQLCLREYYFIRYYQERFKWLRCPRLPRLYNFIWRRPHCQYYLVQVTRSNKLCSPGI
jgi:hypothetical protein